MGLRKFRSGGARDHPINRPLSIREPHTEENSVHAYEVLRILLHAGGSGDHTGLEYLKLSSGTRAGKKRLGQRQHYISYSVEI